MHSCPRLEVWTCIDNGASRGCTWHRSHSHVAHGLQVVIDDSKVTDFLAASSEVFETILDAEDAADGATIERVLTEMEAAESSDIVQHLLAELFPKHKKQQ